MRAKVAKDLRKQAFSNGFHRNTEYEDDVNGVIYTTGEKRDYRILKSAYKKLKAKGR